MKLRSGKGFKLTNDGALEVFFIGTGSASAETLNQTNFILVKGDTHVMVDFGTTGQRALLETAGLKLTDIGVLLPTHSHSDHVGGVEGLALMNRYVGQRFLKKSKIKMIVTEEYQRILWDCTLRGGLEGNEEVIETSQKLSFSDYFDVLRPTWVQHSPREVFKIKIGEINIELFRTKHVPEQAQNWEASFVSYGLFLDGRIFISCDTRFDPDLIEMYADRSEVMFHDVQFFPGAVHAPLAELKTLPTAIKEKMHLMHYADNWRDQNIKDFAGWAQQGITYIF